MPAETSETNPVVTPPEGEDDDRTTTPSKPFHSKAPAARSEPHDAFIRAPGEDDDGYDPYSDRPADPEPPFEEDPWR